MIKHRGERAGEADCMEGFEVDGSESEEGDVSKASTGGPTLARQKECTLGKKMYRDYVVYKYKKILEVVLNVM
jgi:hypothetical protein